MKKTVILLNILDSWHQTYSEKELERFEAAMQSYADQQTSSLRNQLSEKEKEIEELKLDLTKLKMFITHLDTLNPSQKETKTS